MSSGRIRSNLPVGVARLNRGGQMFLFFFLYFDVDNPDTRPLGLAVKEFRIRAGLTQEEVAQRAGLHRTHVGLVERGGRNATFNTISTILAVLQVSWEEFGRVVDQLYVEQATGKRPR